MATTADRLAGLLAPLAPVSLEDMDARASLQRRVDEKFLVEWELVERLARELGDDHDALDIDGRRSFHYDSVYFDTAGLRDFHDHVAGHRPRVKVRSRLYVDSRECSFEVKLKPVGGDTAKRSRDQDAEDHGRLTDADRRFMAEHLRDVGIDEPGAREPSLFTRFARGTLVARSGAERVTCDVGVELARPEGRSVRLRDGLVLIEVKSEEGGGAADRLLREAGAEPVSLSKYRTGIGLLVVGGDEARFSDAFLG